LIIPGSETTEMPLKEGEPPALELHVTSPASVQNTAYSLIGVVRTEADASWLAGSSVRIRSLITGLTDEAFLDDRGSFAQDLELQPETDNSLELTVCDGEGREAARVVVTVRCQSAGQALGQEVLPRQTVAKPLQAGRGQALDPPWPRFAQLARRCLDLAVEAAKATGRAREELFEHVHAQERYAEQAFEEHNQALYWECRENLEKYAGYLDQLMRDALPRPAAPQLPPEEEAKDSVARFRDYLAAVWKHVRAKQRSDLEPRLTEIAGQARGFTQRMKSEPVAVIREAQRLGAEVRKIEEQLTEGRRQSTGDGAGPLEGSS
jgi:hypothetical protein